MLHNNCIDCNRTIIIKGNITYVEQPVRDGLNSILNITLRAEQNSWKELPPNKANGNQKSLGHLKGAKTTAR